MDARSEPSWTLAGYDVGELIGVGQHGGVWRGRDLATLAPVALRRLCMDARSRERIRAEAAVLAAFRHPHVLMLHRVMFSADDIVLVYELGVGGSLADILAARGSVAAGEVVTTAAPLATALADAHARGLMHGAVSAANVLYTADGRPLLADLGLTRLLAAAATEPGATPADDVHALARVCAQMVGDLASAPPALATAIRAGLADQPADRPSAARFASLLGTACPPSPMRLALTASAPESARAVASPPRRRTSSAVPTGGQRPRRLVFAAGLLPMAIVVGWGWARAEGPAPAGELAIETPGGGSGASATASPAPVAADWSAVLRQLVAGRDNAFVTGDPAALGDVYATGAPPYAADVQALRQLTAAGQHAGGLRHEVRSVLPRQLSAARVTLTMVDVLAPYDLLDGHGTPVAHRPGRPARAFTVVLTRASGEWRIAALSAA